MFPEVSVVCRIAISERHQHLRTVSQSTSPRRLAAPTLGSTSSGDFGQLLFGLLRPLEILSCGLYSPTMQRQRTGWTANTGAATILDALFRRCAGAYSEITLRSYRRDIEIFRSWCEARGAGWLPAESETVARFVDEEAPKIAVSTTKRRMCAIQFAHRMSEMQSPVDHSEVYLALRRARRAKRRRPKQALGLTAELLGKIIAACPNTLAGKRDAAMFSVGYDTLCRSSELAAMRVEHLNEDLGSVLVPCSKSDPFGDGRIAYLSPSTEVRLSAWLDAADLHSGPLLRGLHTNKVSEVPLDTCSIRRRIKVAAARARLDKELVRGLSGHSMRIGAAQDMMLAGFDTIGIMQAGGWRTQAVLARYVENASAKHMHVRRWGRLERMHHKPTRVSGCPVEVS